MSVSNISSNFGYSQAAGGHPPRKQEIDALSEALQAGDISSAQQAFSTLFATSSNQTASSNSNSCDDVVTDISALGKALSSGDLDSAQSAFSSLQEDIQNAPPPPPPGGPNGVGGPGGPGGKDDPVQQAFSDLASALESNDIEAAKTAFATLQSLAPDNQNSTADSSSTTSSTTTASTSATDTIGTDLSSLSAALESGDLTSAQTLFQTLLADLQANAPRHPGMDHYSQNRNENAAANATVSVTA